MLKYETFSSFPAIYSICRTQALDHLMSDMNGRTSPDKCSFCDIQTAEYVLK